MADAIFDQGIAGNAAQALMQRRQQLAAQEAAAMGLPGQQPMPQQPVAGAQPPMGQAQFSGYGAGRPQMTPQQIQQLAALLQKRSQ